jgi:hypothetical protein
MHTLEAEASAWHLSFMYIQLINSEFHESAPKARLLTYLPGGLVGTHWVVTGPRGVCGVG